MVFIGDRASLWISRLLDLLIEGAMAQGWGCMMWGLGFRMEGLKLGVQTRGEDSDYGQNLVRAVVLRGSHLSKKAGLRGMQG